MPWPASDRLVDLHFWGSMLSMLWRLKPYTPMPRTLIPKPQTLKAYVVSQGVEVSPANVKDANNAQA